MPLLLHVSNNPDYLRLVQFLVRAHPHADVHVQAIHTTDPVAAIATYHGITPIAIVVVDSPPDMAALVQQLRDHSQFAPAIAVIITGQPHHYHALASPTVLVGDVTDHVRLIEKAFAQYDAPSGRLRHQPPPADA